MDWADGRGSVERARRRHERSEGWTPRRALWMADLADGSSVRRRTNWRAVTLLVRPALNYTVATEERMMAGEGLALDHTIARSDPDTEASVTTELDSTRPLGIGEGLEGRADQLFT